MNGSRVPYPKLILLPESQIWSDPETCWSVCYPSSTTDRHCFLSRYPPLSSDLSKKHQEEEKENMLNPCHSRMSALPLRCSPIHYLDTAWPVTIIRECIKHTWATYLRSSHQVMRNIVSGTAAAYLHIYLSLTACSRLLVLFRYCIHVALLSNIANTLCYFITSPMLNNCIHASRTLSLTQPYVYRPGNQLTANVNTPWFIR